jgi:hypothetical protein
LVATATRRTATKPELVLLPTVSEALAEETVDEALSFVYDQEFLRDRRGTIVGIRVPWLTSPIDGLIRQGQTWKIKDDGKHPKPLNEIEQIRFLAGGAPIVVFGHLSCSFEGFLRLIIRKEAEYIRG